MLAIASPFYLLAVLFVQQPATLINNHCWHVDILKMWLTFLSNMITANALIVLYLFSEPSIVIRVYSNHSFIICNSVLSFKRKMTPAMISFLPECTLNLLLANLSFLSIYQLFWKLGQASDTTHSSQRGIWVWGEFRHRGGSSGSRQLVTSVAYKNDYV